MPPGKSNRKVKWKLSLNTTTLLHSIAQFSNNISRVSSTKDRRARHDNIRASFGGLIDRSQTQTTVNFNVKIGIPGAQSGDLGEFRGHEFLAAETGVDGHDEDHLDFGGMLAELAEDKPMGAGEEETHLWSLTQIRAVEDIPENINGGIGLDGDTGLHALLVDIFDQFARRCAGGGGFVGGIGCGDGGDGSFVVEAVKVTAGLLELVDPFVRLLNGWWLVWRNADSGGWRGSC